MTRADEVRRVAGTHPDVRDCVAMVVDSELVLAVAPRDYASAVEIRDHVWAELGERSPRLVVLVSNLPSSATELREVVAKLEATQQSRYVEAGNELESQLCDIVKEAVQAPRVGALDDFIDLGGDSLSAVALSTLIEERLGVGLLLETVFEASTARGLAEAVRSQAG